MFKSHRAYNDTNMQYSEEENELKEVKSLGIEELLIFDDLDNTYDKRTWQYKVNQSNLEKIQKRLTNCRHKTKEHPPQTVIITGRPNNIYSGISSNCSIHGLIMNEIKDLFILFLLERDTHSFQTFYLSSSMLLGSKT